MVWILKNSAWFPLIATAKLLPRCAVHDIQRRWLLTGLKNGASTKRHMQFRQIYIARNSAHQKGMTICLLDRNSQPNQNPSRSFTEDRKTTALTLIKDLKHLKSSPIPALVLGLAGVIPFAAAPAYLIFSGHFMSSIAFSQVAYGACILSFLGGVRWGLTVSPDESVRPDWFNLGYSVTPSLIAWVGLLLPTSASILVLISGLLGACFMDVTMWGYPPWFKALRFLLTFMAVLSLWTTLMCRLLMKSEKKEVKEAKPEKEKRSWLRLPWKSSKPASAPELQTKSEAQASLKIVELPSKVEESAKLEQPLNFVPVMMPEPQLSLPELPPIEPESQEGNIDSEKSDNETPK